METDINNPAGNKQNIPPNLMNHIKFSTRPKSINITKTSVYPTPISSNPDHLIPVEPPLVSHPNRSKPKGISPGRIVRWLFNYRCGHTWFSITYIAWSIINK